LINGSRKEVEDDYRSGGRRSRSRSKGTGGGLAALATAGLAGLAGKKLLDRSRSRSRSRGGGSDRRRRYSSDSYDSRSPSPRRGVKKDRHRRSKSVSDYARKGLAALGIGEATNEADRRHEDSREIEETHVYRSRRGGSDDSYEPRRSRNGGGTRSDPYGDPQYADSRTSDVGSRGNGGVGGGGGNAPRSSRQKDGQRNRRIAEGKEAGSESDTSSLGSSSGDEKRIRKMKAHHRH